MLRTVNEMSVGAAGTTWARGGFCAAGAAAAVLAAPQARRREASPPRTPCFSAEAGVATDSVSAETSELKLLSAAHAGGGARAPLAGGVEIGREACVRAGCVVERHRAGGTGRWRVRGKVGGRRTGVRGEHFDLHASQGGGMSRAQARMPAWSVPAQRLGERRGSGGRRRSVMWSSSSQSEEE